ncbi:MAG: FliM/FliN family flagellar motor switch protein [Deltaproteobacteria bacterium]|nr:FliM/FliN family flagellar motor switch protein [Deltaproteobacteria bacterium]
MHAELATALEAVGTGLGSALGGPVGVTARLLPSASGTARLLPRRSVFALLDLSSVGSPAVLEVEPPFATAVLAAVAGGRPQRGPSNSLTRIERAAWGYLLLEVILAARSSAFIREQLAPRLLSVHDFREEFGARLPKVPWVTVELGLRFAAMEGTALLHLPAHALQMALQQVPQSSRDEPAAEGGLAAVDVEFAVTAASHVPTSDWARLTAGDVVMVDRLSGGLPAWRGTVALQTAGFELEGVLDAGRFAFTRARRRASPPESSMPQPHSMDDVTCTLPLALQVELGTAQVPIGALHALKPGAVVSLHLNPASPVSLKLGGRTVARAELVDVDGAVGARILEVLP